MRGRVPAGWVCVCVCIPDRGRGRSGWAAGARRGPEGESQERGEVGGRGQRKGRSQTQGRGGLHGGTSPGGRLREAPRPRLGSGTLPAADSRRSRLRCLSVPDERGWRLFPPAGRKGWAGKGSQIGANSGSPLCLRRPRVKDAESGPEGFSWVAKAGRRAEGTGEAEGTA